MERTEEVKRNRRQYYRIIKIISSCKTINQFERAEKIISGYDKQHSDRTITTILTSLLFYHKSLAWK